jgi:hypothetical protein
MKWQPKEGVAMFDRKQFVPTVPIFTPPAPMKVDEIQDTLNKLAKKGHPMDTPVHKIPIGNNFSKNKSIYC